MTQRAKHGQRLLREWKKSGLSQAEFCRRRGIPAMTFYGWKRQLKDRLAGVRRPSGRKDGGTSRRPGGHGAAFIEVKPIGHGARQPLSICETAPVCTYEVVLSGGRVVRIPDQFDPEVVARLISAVEAVC